MSLLRLRSGPLIRFNPLDLGRETLRMWLSAKDIDNAALVTNDGAGRISSLASRNLAGQIFTAATTARPTFGATGQGGVAPAYVADGVANAMTMASTLGLPTGSASSVMIALASGTPANAGRLFEYGQTGTNATRKLNSAQINVPNEILASNGTVNATAAHRTWASPAIAVGSWAADLTEAVRVDGGAFSASTTMAALATTTNRARIFASASVAASAFGAYALSELFLLSGSIATLLAAIEKIEGYVAWDPIYLPLNLAASWPDDHPYKGGPP